MQQLRIASKKVMRIKLNRFCRLEKKSEIYFPSYKTPDIPTNEVFDPNTKKMHQNLFSCGQGLVQFFREFVDQMIRWASQRGDGEQQMCIFISGPAGADVLWHTCTFSHVRHYSTILSDAAHWRQR